MDTSKAVTRRYSDVEVARILTRTAELQAASSSDLEPYGLTQGELEQIAREVGLDAAHVGTAIAELESGPPTGQSRWLGGPVWIRFERSVPGDLPDSEHEALVEIIQGALNEVGQASVLGRTLRWHAVTASGRHEHGREIEVSVAVRSGQTIVRVQERLRSLAKQLFVGSIAGGGSTAGILAGSLAGSTFGPLVGLGLGGLAVLGSYALARGVFGWKSRARAEQLRRLTDRLAERAAEASRAAGLEAGSQPERLGSGRG